VHAQRRRDGAEGGLGVERPDRLQAFTQGDVAQVAEDLQQRLLHAGGAQALDVPPLRPAAVEEVLHVGREPVGPDRDLSRAWLPAGRATRDRKILVRHHTSLAMAVSNWPNVGGSPVSV